MKATSLPNLNHEPTSYDNFFTFIQDPNHHDDTTVLKRPNIDHSHVTEPSETSPFKDILSPFVSSNGSNENHYPVGGYLYERDQNQMDQTLPRWPPSPTRSSDTTVSVGSNPFSGNVAARSEGPNFTRLRWDQILPNTSSVGSTQLSGNVGARSEGPNVTQLRGDQTLPSMSSVGSYQSSGNVGASSAGPNFSQLELPRDKRRVTTQTPPLTWSMMATYGLSMDRNLSSMPHTQGTTIGAPTSMIKVAQQLNRPAVTWTKITSNLIDDGHAWRKYGQKDILDAKFPRNYYRCTHRHDQGCRATKQVQKTDEDPPTYQTTYQGNHTCRNPPAPHLIQESVPLDANC